MYIKNISIKNNLIFAPLAGITDSPTRIITKRFGAGMVFSEMISSEGLIRYHQKTEELLYFTEEERPIALQIFGSNPEHMAKAAFIAEQKNADAIDLNLGCPVNKVIKAQSGSYLLQFPDKVSKIISSVRKKINIPLTVKIRAGWKKDQINAVQIAKIAENEGADAIIIHPRTREQMFSGKADWEIIADVKQSVRIPVIGNGDVLTPQDAKRMFDETKCDAIMIGRGALGNPWIFNITEHFLNTGIMPSLPTSEEKIKIALQHFDYEVQYKGENRGVRESYKIIFWYLKGLPNTINIKKEIIKHIDSELIRNILKEYQINNAAI
ncbi:tRNA dihydrouridine synthase DusB [Candidatus Poribacteria bacterium]|nr:tRNA dihydrouridine synthase DusB [Candidatus Poribacteria bacterium]